VSYLAVKRQKSTHAKPAKHNLVVVEVAGQKRRVRDKPHLFVFRTQRGVRDSFARLKNGEGPSWVSSLDLKLRLDLVPKYKPTSKFKVAKERLERLKIDLARKGFAINRDVSTWRVYVLDIDPDVAPAIGNRGKLGKVIYVGQTSAAVERRLAQHQGQILSKSGKFIGSSKVRNRNPTLNRRLSPKKVLFTKNDALAFETRVHQKFEDLGYRVLGDSPASTE
jgi:hypothetical protein